MRLAGISSARRRSLRSLRSSALRSESTSRAGERASACASDAMMFAPPCVENMTSGRSRRRSRARSGAASSSRREPSTCTRTSIGTSEMNGPSCFTSASDGKTRVRSRLRSNVSTTRYQPKLCLPWPRRAVSVSGSIVGQAEASKSAAPARSAWASCASEQRAGRYHHETLNNAHPVSLVVPGHRLRSVRSE